MNDDEIYRKRIFSVVEFISCSEDELEQRITDKIIKEKTQKGMVIQGSTCKKCNLYFQNVYYSNNFKCWKCVIG